MIADKLKPVVKKIPLLDGMARGLLKRVKIIVGTKRLKKLAVKRPLKLVIGASGIFDEGWIGTDIEYLNLLEPAHWEKFFAKGSVRAMLAEHVWEHLTKSDGLVGAKRCFEYLEPGGYLRVAVPDGFCPNVQYIDYVKPGGTGPGADDHRVLYNHLTFAQLFEEAGFKVDRLEYFDEKGEFHFVDWKPEDGTIIRSRRFDERNTNGALNYTSLIFDVYKGAKPSL